MDELELIYKRISQGLLASALMTGGLLLSPQIILGTVFAVGMVLSIVFGFYYSFKLFRALPGLLPLRNLWVGVFIVLGGALIDIIVTVFCSPDLSREGNPIVVLLFDLNFSLVMIYTVLFCIQVLMVSTCIILWASFLKIYPKLLRNIPYKNLFITCKWWIGCGKMSFLDFILNRNSNYCFFISFCTFLLVLSHLNRWYCAMEWLNLVPFSRLIPGAVVFMFMCLFLIKTHMTIKLINQKIGLANDIK